MKAQVKKLLGGRTALRIRHHSGAILRSTAARLEGPYKINQHLLENSAALLQSTIYTVESLQQIKSRLAALEEQGAALKEQNQALLGQKNNRIVRRAGQYGAANPEIGLMQHLYAYLPSRNAIDVGANVGRVSERLLEAGYRVYAFEPFPPVFEQLRERLGHRASFHPVQLALGADDRKMDLHIAQASADSSQRYDTTLYNSLSAHPMPDDLCFDGTTIEVYVRSLESLWNSSEIPEEIGLLKIDAEGYDLEVIRGMGERRRPAVVMAEFWDANFVFGKQGERDRLAELVSEMRRRAYHRHIVVYRTEESGDISFYCNQDHAIENSWGNVFFFRDYEIFREALQWCSTILPPTYFTD